MEVGPGPEKYRPWPSLLSPRRSTPWTVTLPPVWVNVAWFVAVPNRDAEIPRVISSPADIS